MNRGMWWTYDANEINIDSDDGWEMEEETAGGRPDDKGWIGGSMAGGCKGGQMVLCDQESTTEVARRDDVNEANAENGRNDP